MYIKSYILYINNCKRVFKKNLMPCIVQYLQEMKVPESKENIKMIDALYLNKPTNRPELIPLLSNLTATELRGNM